MKPFCSKCGMDFIMPEDPSGEIEFGLCPNCAIAVADMLQLFHGPPPQDWPKDAQEAYRQGFSMGFGGGFWRGWHWGRGEAHPSELGTPNPEAFKPRPKSE